MDLNEIKPVEKREWMEKARLFAESQMPEDWNRKDQINVSIFYIHMLDFIGGNYKLIPRP